MILFLGLIVGYLIVQVRNKIKKCNEYMNNEMHVAPILY